MLKWLLLMLLAPSCAPSRPVHVHLDPSLPPRMALAARQAVNVWGGDVLVLDDVLGAPGEFVSVYLKPRSACQGMAGYTEVTWAPGGPVAGYVWLCEVVEDWDADDLLGVAVHEYGHALGLEHSPDAHNVMWYASPVENWYISDEQREAVR